jgi:hypothetical protein
MSYNLELERVKDPAWTAYVVVTLCQTLKAAFQDWKLQDVSSLTTDPGTAAALVQEILKCEDQDKCKKGGRVIKRSIY